MSFTCSSWLINRYSGYLSTSSRRAWAVYQTKLKTTSSRRSSFDANRGKFIQIAALSMFKMQIKNHFSIVTSSRNTAYWYYMDFRCPHKAITSNWKQMVAQPPEPLPEGAVRCPTIKQSVLSVKGHRIRNIIPQAIWEWPTHTTSKPTSNNGLKQTKTAIKAFSALHPAPHWLYDTYYNLDPCT